MPYRIRYTLNVDYVAPGVGLGMTVPINAGDPGLGAGATFFFAPSVQPSSNTFTNTDVAAMLAAMLADLTAQLDATATQTKIQNVATFSAIPPPSGA